jgi:hypothetical protein
MIFKKNGKLLLDLLIMKYLSIGRVRHVKTGRILKPRQRQDDYLQVYLYENRIRNTYRVHRVVAKEFIDKP